MARPHLLIKVGSVRNSNKSEMPVMSIYQRAREQNTRPGQPSIYI